MEPDHTLSLISGTYTPNEAKEILVEMIKAKINFHHLKNLSTEIRFDKSDLPSKKRILELTQAKENLMEFINKASLSSKNIKIKAELLIELVED